MTRANTTQNYGSVAKTFHWLTALLIVTLIPLGIIANGLPYETPAQVTQKALLFSIHKTLGITVFFVALARILWALRQVKPGSLNPDRAVEHWLAETVHWLLYGSLVLVPLTGWIMHAASEGFAPIWWPFGQSLPFVPKDDDIVQLFRGLHIVFERVLALSILLHVAGALKHHFVDKDTTLLRMWFGKPKTPEVAASKHNSVPLISALTAWTVALGIGGMLGLYAPHTTSVAAQPTRSLEAPVAAGWDVQSGEIAIEIVQFGTPVSGTFADWNAAINFDPDIQSGLAGNVNVRISIPSLTLGSVTDQAMGPDYFDATTFPEAQFTADIRGTDDGYEAIGTLAIKDTSVPITLPFSLQLTDGTAVMQAQTTLQRLDFGIGASMADESSLGFDVSIAIQLTALPVSGN